MRRIPGKHGPDIVNKAVQKIAIGSKGSRGLVHLTRKATTARIRADMKAPGPDGKTPLLIYLAVISLKRKHVTGATAGNWKIMVRAEARRILAARIRSIGATIAGWLHGLSKLKASAGLTGRTSEPGVLKLMKGSAAESYAETARSNRLVAGLFNTVEGSDKVSTNAVIQSAVNEATRDNVDYLVTKFGAAIRDAVNGTSMAGTIQ